MTTNLNDEKRERIMRTVRALKEKTVANGCTEAEAMAASEKADALLREYNLTLDEAFIEAEVYGARRRNYGKARAIRHHAFQYCSVGIAKFTGTRVIVHIDENENTGDLTFFGTPMDTELAFFLLDHIKAAIDTAWKLEAARLRAEGLTPRKYENVYKHGMTGRITARLHEMASARKGDQQASTTALMVVKDAIVDDRFAKWRRELAGRLKTGRRTTVRGDREAFARGRAAGDAVSLNRPLSGSGAGSSQRRLG